MTEDSRPGEDTPIEPCQPEPPFPSDGETQPEFESQIRPDWDEMDEEDEDEEEEKTSRTTLIIIGVVAVILLAILAWLYRPVISEWVSVVRTLTPTPVPPTSTPLPTRTPTVTASPTPAPTATSTPYSVSAYSVDSLDLQPPLPWYPSGIYVLDDDQAVTPDPEFANLSWTHSSAVLNQLPGIVINEPYYTTQNRGSAKWQMDAPLKPGFYEIYVSDTTYSSSSWLDFQVLLDQQLLQPLTGRQRVEYWTTRGSPAQVQDLWHSIGIYNVDRDGLLSVSTAWDARDEFSGPVAIDRVLIVPQSDNNVNILSRLPADRVKYIVDDSQADIGGADFLLDVEDQVSWNDKYVKVINTAKDIKVTWDLQDNVPVGTYDVAVFIPEIQGNAMVTYRLIANGVELARSDDTMLVSSVQGNWPGGQWIMLGSWEIPRTYEPRVHLALQMDILANTPGEAAIDAIVFMTTPPPPEE